jgi:hypothetical protein
VINEAIPAAWAMYLPLDNSERVARRAPILVPTSHSGGRPNDNIAADRGLFVTHCGGLRNAHFDSYLSWTRNDTSSRAVAQQVAKGKIADPIVLFCLPSSYEWI